MDTLVLLQWILFYLIFQDNTSRWFIKWQNKYASCRTHLTSSINEKNLLMNSYKPLGNFQGLKKFFGVCRHANQMCCVMCLSLQMWPCRMASTYLKPDGTKHMDHGLRKVNLEKACFRIFPRTNENCGCLWGCKSSGLVMFWLIPNVTPAQCQYIPQAQWNPRQFQLRGRERWDWPQTHGSQV